MNPLTLKIAALVTVLIFSFEADTENQPQRTDKEREKGPSGSLLKVDKEKHSLIYWKNVISQFNSTYPQENIYIMTDNTSYRAGGTVYFAAWVRMDGTGSPSRISKVIHVDIVNAAGHAVLRGKYPVNNGQASGTLTLPKTQQGGQYRLRAYTKWQQNFGKQNLYTLTIKIHNPTQDYGFNYSKKLERGKETDTLTLKIVLTDIHKRPLPGSKLTVKISGNGLKWEKAESTTDEIGQAEVKYIIPHIEKAKTIYLTASYKDGWRTMIRKKTIEIKKEETEVKFYPEGGNTIEGIENETAFKITNERGEGVDAEGRIIEESIEDENGQEETGKGKKKEGRKEIKRIKTEHEGMGKFRYTPKKGKTYKAEIWKKGEAEKKKEYALPKAQTSGYNIICTRQTQITHQTGTPTENNILTKKRASNKLQTKTTSNETSINTAPETAPETTLKIKITRVKEAEPVKTGTPDKEEAGLLLQRGGKTELFKKIEFQKGQTKDSIILSLPTGKMKQGIHQLTIFNKKGEPEAERLIFIRQKGKGEITLNIAKDKENYGPREKILANLYAQDKNGNPVKGSFAVTVRDITREAGRNQKGQNLINTLLLTSGLKGEIKNPEYYMESGHEKEADLLMLTQGWRRYKWKRETLKEKFTPENKAEKGIVIQGEVKSLTLKRPVKNCEVTMLLHLDSTLYADKTKTNEDGQFNFVCNFTGRHTLQLQTSSGQKKSGKAKKIDKLIMLDREAAPAGEEKYEEGEPWKETRTDRKTKEQTGQAKQNQSKGRNQKVEQTVTIGDGGTTVRRTKEGYEKTLPEVEVKKKTFDETMQNEAVATYDAEKIREDLKDKGEFGFNTTSLKGGLFEMLYNQDPEHWNVTNGGVTYKGLDVKVVNASWSENEMGKLDGGYTVNDIKKILVIEDPQIIQQYLLNDQGYGNLFDYSAVVVFYLYPDGKRRSEPIGVRNTYFNGYTLVKEFYIPNYSKNNDLSEPDSRRTLYWDPDVRTDSTGRAVINFYNNDNSINMEFMSEGFSDSGFPGAIIKE